MTNERVGLEKVTPPEEAALIRPSYHQPAREPGAENYDLNPADDNINLHELWRKIQKRRWLILTIATIITTIVTIESFRFKSIYEASTTIEIEKENKTLLKSGDLVIQADESDDANYVSLGMKTKIRVLQSRPLLEDVVSTLKLDQNP